MTVIYKTKNRRKTVCNVVVINSELGSWTLTLICDNHRRIDIAKAQLQEDIIINAGSLQANMNNLEKERDIKRQKKAIKTMVNMLVKFNNKTKEEAEAIVLALL